jgi:hypothetical protein
VPARLGNPTARGYVIRLKEGKLSPYLVIDLAEKIEGKAATAEEAAILAERILPKLAKKGFCVHGEAGTAMLQARWPRSEGET